MTTGLRSASSGLCFILASALLSPVALAQPNANGAAAAAVALQEAQERAFLQTTILLQLYAAQGQPVTPEMRAQAVRQANEYFSNGAQATGVPSTGPGATYFTNGAAVSTIPTSVIPDYSFQPPFPEEQQVPAEAGAPNGAVDAGPPAPPPAAPAAQGAIDAGVAPTPTSPASGVETSTPTATDGGVPPESENTSGGSPTSGSESSSPSMGNGPTTSNSPPALQATAVASATLPSPVARPAPPESAVHPTSAVSAGSVLLVMAGGVGVASLLLLTGAVVRPGSRRPRSI